MRTVILLFAACGGLLAQRQATLAILHANVWTGDPKQPSAEAIAACGETLCAVGTDREIQNRIGPQTRVIDAKGRMVTPGFIDSHVHFLTGGFSLSSVQLRDAATPAEFIARIKAFASQAPAGAWITGGDWDHERWGGELPRRDWIDAVSAGHPVWVNRLDGHMSLANSAALKAAGVDRNTKDIAGGTIVRDAKGEPTGILKDNALSLVDRAVPDPPNALKDEALNAAMRYVAAQGVTSVHHMGTWDDLAVFERAHHKGALQTRIYAAVPLDTWRKLSDTIQQHGRGDAWLHVGGLKGFVDGSLGSHTAAFLQPFTDAPNDRGLLVNTPDNLYKWTASAARAGLQVMVHAIGDRAIRTQLDIFERIEKEQHPADPRFRIEHAQHIAPADLPRFGQLSIIASMQPYHAIDDGRWAEKVIGKDRCRTTYAFRSLLDSKARLTFGSDWDVAPATPLEGIYAAVTRRTLDDKNPQGWFPEQKITVEQALRAYTQQAAYAEFQEQTKGSLTPGKLADFVLIDRDIRAIPPETIRQAQVDLTVVGGKAVFEREP